MPRAQRDSQQTFKWKTYAAATDEHEQAGSPHFNPAERGRGRRKKRARAEGK